MGWRNRFLCFIKVYKFGLRYAFREFSHIESHERIANERINSDVRKHLNTNQDVQMCLAVCASKQIATATFILLIEEGRAASKRPH
jgi:hypothetical protein